MGNKLIDLINSDTEPVYALSGYLQHLSDNKKCEFWELLKELAFSGTEQQKFVVLSFISLEEHNSQVELINKFVSEIPPTSASVLLLPLLRMIQNVHREDLVSYCNKVLEAALERNDAKMVEMAFRTILVIDWASALSQLSLRIQTNNAKQIVDIMAFFKRTHTLLDWEELLKTLQESDRKRVKELESDIDIRNKNHVNCK